MPVVIYGIDGANNKVETLTKEQILDAIAQAQLGESMVDYDRAFISQIKEINHGAQLRFWIGTQAEYNALQTHDINVLYIISDDTSKEEILAAIDALSHSLDGVDAAIAAKQDELTFDATPTQESENPVTSGGIFTAIENAKTDVVQGTLLWERPRDPEDPDEYDTSVFRNEDDIITLNDDISNYDYVDIYLFDDCSDVRRFTVHHGGVIPMWWISIDKIAGEYQGLLYANRMDIWVYDNRAKAQRAFSISLGSNPNSNAYFTDVRPNINKIYGIKLS